MKEKNDIPTARAMPPTDTRFRIHIVWLVPIVAFLVAGYLVINRFVIAGPVVTITFADGGGLQADRTVLRYRGVKVGTVRAVRLSGDGASVEVQAGLDRSAARLARAGSLFWIVRPEVNAAGLHGLDTIVSGAYIQVQPGQGADQKKFTGSDETPMLRPTPGSLELVLTTAHVGSLNVGASVSYRGMEVGSVRSLILGENATNVNIHLEIQPRYAQLVRQNTEFWNAGGLSVSLKLFGVNVSAESVRSLLVGGIEFATPPPPGPPASPNGVFVLHEKVEEKWLKWAPPLPGWAGSNGPPTNAASSRGFQSLNPLTTNEMQ